jgi:hypothetical protein
MMSWFFVYLIGVVVGIALDNLFWMGVAHLRQMDNERE